MASATKSVESVETTVTVETTKGVTLKLTPEEARTLAVVLAKVGGSPRISPREHVQSVLNALYDVGITFKGASEHALLASGLGGLVFNNYPTVEG